MRSRRNLIITVVLLVAALLSSLSVATFYQTHPTTTQSTRSGSLTSKTQTYYNPIFSINQIRALSFYQEIAITSGSGSLLETFPGSQVIYVADDQALDYYALESIFNSTGNSLANSEAREVNSSISSWGGFFKYWNPVFVVVGDYPGNWVWSNGVDQEIGSIISSGENYTVNATIFFPNPRFDYYNYADQELYFSFWNLHAGNYSASESAFEIANSFWDGYGFADKTFSTSNGVYTSYKLALDLIVWKSLEANPNTIGFANNYVPEMKNVTSIMSVLQGTDGGVWTNYMIRNGSVIANASISRENGETTSLFVLACNLK